MVEALRLVISIAKNTMGSLIFRFNSRGNIGLMKAVDKFEYREDVSFQHMPHGGLDKQ